MRFCIMTKNEEVKKDFEFISKEISDKKLFFIENDTQNALKDITTYATPKTSSRGRTGTSR